MNNNLIFKHIPQSEVTDEIFEKIMKIESSRDSGYDEKSMNVFWRTSGINENFICLIDNEIVGHISYNPNSKRRNGSIFMVNLTVSPNHTRKGIAQGLISYACDYFLSNGHTKPMSTSVDKDNEPAVKLYLKCGFKIREPICEADEDDEQYIMDNKIEIIKSKINQNTNGDQNE